MDDVLDAARVVQVGTGTGSRGSIGEASLFATRNSSACWVRTPAAQVYQKSLNHWAANLYGGVQSNDDWASVVLPINEMPIASLTSAQWTYFMTNAESAGVNLVVWLHDAADFSKRVEVTQLMGLASKSALFNVEMLDDTATEMFFYGENTTGTDLTAGTLYTWAEFQADVLFSTWTIYRITLDYGWLASSTLEDAWLTEVAINGQQVLLKPDSGGTGRYGVRHFTVASGDLTGTIAPKTPFRLISLDLHISSSANAGELFTITKDAEQDTLYDTVVFSSDLGALGLTSLYETFEGMMMFSDGDELDILHTNSEDDDYGVTLTYQTVFP
jgi:hypothetical protein